jgi:hypothetical protein
MATSLFSARKETMKPMAVSSSELLAFRSGLLNNVVPYVPRARERFEKHFLDSYALLQSLRGEMKGNIPSGFTLTVIGVKSFFVAKPPLSGALMRQFDAISSLGMGFRPRLDMQVEVYNAGELAPVLSSMTGQPTRSATEIESALEAFVTLNRMAPEKYPYSVLGWSAIVTSGKSYPMCTITTDGDSVQSPFINDLGASLMKGLVGAFKVATDMGRAMSQFIDTVA